MSQRSGSFKHQYKYKNNKIALINAILEMMFSLISLGITTIETYNHL